MIDRQATTLAYVQVISILAVIILCLVPFLLIMKRNRPASGEQTAVH
jgi:heme/copper-type cytochrome/quinol oxidase subunit 4